MAERSRINSSTAAVMASGGSAGIQLLQRRTQPRYRPHLALRLAQQRAGRPEGFLQRRHRRPTQLREQPDGGLLDELVFGVGVRAHERAMNQSNKQMTADSTLFASKGNPLYCKGSHRIACFLRALLLTKLG